ncbi:MAG: DUF1664 domain-containing protein [Candidatus Bathyarchaeota archaeon]|nr:DUF1664 domain-containing protein [Candidatus Bathyarchaeota archaeon]
MDWTELIPALTGSGGSVLVMLLLASAAYKFLEKHLIPMLQAAITRHLDQIDRLLDKHDHTAKAIEDVSDEVTDLGRKVDDVGRKVEDCGRRLDALAPN